MTLATHAVTGAVVGALVAHNPALAAVGGAVSHFLLDAIPHWDYKLGSANVDKENPLAGTIHINKQFFFDLLKIGSDFLLGIVLITLLFIHAAPYVLLAAFVGAGAAMAPDFLQFVYFRFRREPLTSLQWFHVAFMHAKIDLKSRPVLGISLQVILIAILCFIAWNYII